MPPNELPKPQNELADIRLDDIAVADTRTESLDSEDEKQYWNEKRKHELSTAAAVANLANVNVAQAKQNLDERKRYAECLFGLICFWLTYISVVTWKCASIGSHFVLSDSVLIALIGSTTASVISIFLIVANYLFPKPKD